MASALYQAKKVLFFYLHNKWSDTERPHTIRQGCRSRCSLAAGLRGNGERMRKWKENEEMDRKLGNGQRMRKWTENEEMDRN